MILGPPGLPYKFAFDDRVMEIPDVDGPTLIDLIMRGQWLQIMPGMLGDDDQAWVWEHVADRSSRVRLWSLWRVAGDVVYAATGFPWHAARKLLGTAHAQWMNFHGWCIRKGIGDPRRETDACRLLTCIYTWIMDGMGSEADAQKVWREIFAPEPVVIMALGGERPVWLADYDRRLIASAAARRSDAGR